ncbi:response regulator [Rhizobium sp. AQ_MP]|uniref:response regulator n=1 Tax=Rhizobium sp. AQ_MP TaxID=2761536 RepID=UPI0016395CF1|nr:response regulator [Rhizobium sp. AQ_MP]MBC2774946.1 response regulator [Rhizobium sp. AQ_MP]
MPTSPMSSFPARQDKRRKAEVLFLSLSDRAGQRILKALQAEYQIRSVETIEQLRQTLLTKGIDLLILDRSADPCDDVVQFCRDIRLTSSVAIILMVGSDDPNLRIEALEAGADDCFSQKTGLAGDQGTCRQSLASGSLWCRRTLDKPGPVLRRVVYRPP